MSWQTVKQEAKEAGYEVGSSIYYKLEEGKNRVRILGEFKAYGSHFNKARNTSIVCVGKDKGCPVCAYNDKVSVEKKCPVKPRYVGYVIDRNDGKVKLAEFGYQIISAIGDLALTEDWAFEDAPDYDMIIIKTVGAQTKYSVQPTPKKFPITAEEQEALDNFITTYGDLDTIIEKKKAAQMEKNAGQGKPSNVITAAEEEEEEPITEEEPEDKSFLDSIPF